MRYRLLLLCLVLALAPGLAAAQSPALIEAYIQFSALHAQGRYAEAEPFARRALKLAEREFGSSHLSTATMLNNLARLYEAQGRYPRPRPLHRRSLAIWEKALGPEHPHVAASLENYAALLRETGRSAEADEMAARAKAIRDKRARENP